MIWLLIPAAYLLGSVSFAWLAGRSRGIDLRRHGSGNLGATNAGRVLGRKWFFAIFAADFAKGLVPAMVAVQAESRGEGGPTLTILTALAVVIGHCFPCFHGFKGGKAVATSLGVLVAMLWQVAAIAFVAWLITWATAVLLLRRKASAAVGPASMVAALVTPVAYLATVDHPWALAKLPLTAFIVLISVFVLIRHRSNLARLLAGSRA